MYRKRRFTNYIVHNDIVVHPLNHRESQNFPAYRLKVLIKEFEMY